MINKFGFTLVEILVVITVLAIAGFLVVNILASALRGNNKSQILSSVKKNGQVALETVDKTIRDADSVVCVSSEVSINEGITLVVFGKAGLYTRYRFIVPSPSSNGYIQVDNPTKQNIAEGGRQETSPEFVNRVCAPSAPMQSPLILTDTRVDSGVSLQNGTFKIDKSAGYKSAVTIKFKIAAPIGAHPQLTGQIDPVEFATTVELR